MDKENRSTERARIFRETTASTWPGPQQPLARRGWIWYRGAIRRSGEAMTCGSPSVTRFRPRPGYIHRLPHPCHVPSPSIAKGSIPLFAGYIWIRTSKMHPYLIGRVRTVRDANCYEDWLHDSESRNPISHEWSNIDSSAWNIFLKRIRSRRRLEEIHTWSLR